MPGVLARGDDLVGAGYDSDDFKPLKRLGYGDMGTVFLATLRRSGQPLAMKVMNKEVVRARKSEYRVEREREILAALDHRFAPKLFSHFETKKHIYFIMDYCPGGDMNSLRQRQPEKRFSENAARFYGAEICLAIEYLHKSGIIYRDLKPENVLIQEDGHIMLTDFDLSVKLENQDHFFSSSPSPHEKTARSSVKKSRRSPFMCGSPASVDVICATRKAVEVKPSHRPTKKIFPSEMRGRKRSSNNKTSPLETEVIKSQSFVGTEEYVAPEMVLGSGHGRALDWWTMGIFLYEMIYGTTPFKGKNRRETFLNILSSQPVFPGDWTEAADLISKLLVRDPSKRLGSRGGAEEIKSHAFFQGVDWEALEHVCRPPWVPEPLRIDEEKMEAVAVDELLKHTITDKTSKTIINTATKKMDMELDDDDQSVVSFRRSRFSSASSTISYDFSEERDKWIRDGSAKRPLVDRATTDDSFGEF